MISMVHKTKKGNANERSGPGFQHIIGQHLVVSGDVNLARFRWSTELTPPMVTLQLLDELGLFLHDPEPLIEIVVIAPSVLQVEDLYLLLTTAPLWRLFDVELGAQRQHVLELS